MYKHSELTPLIIVAVDSKFKYFDYQRFEIDYLKKYCNIKILDLGELYSKSYYGSISAVEYRGQDITSVSTYRKLFKEIMALKSNSLRSNTVVMNFIRPTSFASLCFLIAINKLAIKSVVYYNSGWPIVPKKNRLTFRFIMKGSLRRFFNTCGSLIDISPTHYLYAGNYWKSVCESRKNKFKTSLIAGSTWDYSNFLIKGKKSIRPSDALNKSAVLLDGAGPMFGSDDVHIGKKTFFTNDVWYPSLVKFFEKVEELSGVKIDVAGHPKSLHKDNPLYFGGRNVFYGKTTDLIETASFVITRASTALSYAIILNKPILLIYSKTIIELLNLL